MAFWKSPLKLALIASLAVNVFFVSVIVGHRLSGYELRPPRGGDPIMRMVRDAPEDIKQVAREVRDQHRDRLRTLRRDRRQAEAAVIAAMRAEPFDREALAAAFQQRSQASRAMWTVIAEVRNEIIFELTPAQRDRVAAGFERRAERWRLREQRRQQQQEE
ncbi:MAG: periplasmic heavy metal sensor [Pseudomonadota bacterium]